MIMVKCDRCGQILPMLIPIMLEVTIPDYGTLGGFVDRQEIHFCQECKDAFQMFLSDSAKAATE